MVGVVATRGRGENVVTKIRTVHAKGDIQKQITDDSILYLGENKKETNKWFQAQGQRVPMGGTKYDFIRSIPQLDGFVNNFDENPHSDRRKIVDISNNKDADNAYKSAIKRNDMQAVQSNPAPRLRRRRVGSAAYSPANANKKDTRRCPLRCLKATKRCVKWGKND